MFSCWFEQQAFSKYYICVYVMIYLKLFPLQAEDMVIHSLFDCMLSKALLYEHLYLFL